MKLIIPKEDVEAVEQARLELHELFDSLELTDDNPLKIKLSRLINITTPLWRISHKKYDKIVAFDD